MLRLFIALHLPDNIKQLLSAVITDLKTRGGKVKYVEPKNMHLTLKFLGNTEKEMVEPIIETLQNAVGSYTPFESSITKLGGFPNLKKPRVIWVDLFKNREILGELSQRINNSLENLGIEKENKPFKPHLTLGRIKDDRDLNELTDYLSGYKLEETKFIFDKISLIQSKLTQTGPIYKSLFDINLEERFG